MRFTPSSSDLTTRLSSDRRQVAYFCCVVCVICFRRLEAALLLNVKARARVLLSRFRLVEYLEVPAACADM